MATLNNNRSTLSDVFAPPGELIVVGQVAMDTDLGGRRTMPTDGVGSPIGGWLLRTQMEAVTGPWTVRPLHEAQKEVGDVNETVEKGARVHCLTANQNIALKYYELQHWAMNGELGIFLVCRWRWELL